MKESIPTIPPPEPKQEFDIELRMASVCYVHSSTFLEELNSCASDFKQYMTNLAQSIRLAATEIALGIVHRRAEAISHQSTMDEAFGTPPRIRRAGSGVGQGSFRSSTPYAPFGGDHYNSLGRGARITAPAPTPRPDPKRSPEIGLNLDVVMQTPILVVPRHERSFEVLVAHLGEITVRNQTFSGSAQADPGMPYNADRVDRYIVRVADMNLHSVNLIKKVAKREDDVEEEDSLNLLSIFRLMSAQDLYSCDVDAAVPILHDTAVDLRIDRVASSRCGGGLMKESESYNSFVLGELDFTVAPDLSDADVTYHAHGMVMNPLKLSVYRYQYELLLDCVKYLTSGGGEEGTSHPAPTEPVRKTSVPHAQSSVETAEFSRVECAFAIPQLILELRGDLMNSLSKSADDDALVRLECQEFGASFEKREPHSHTLEIALKSLVMEDLQLDKSSKHRKLMTSISDDANNARNLMSHCTSGLSSSCPEGLQQRCDELGGARLGGGGASLPERLDTETVFGAAIESKLRAAAGHVHGRQHKG